LQRRSVDGGLDATRDVDESRGMGLAGRGFGGTWPKSNPCEFASHEPWGSADTCSRSIGVPVCGFTGLSSPVTKGWRLESRPNPQAGKPALQDPFIAPTHVQRPKVFAPSKARFVRPVPVGRNPTLTIILVVFIVSTNVTL